MAKKNVLELVEKINSENLINIDDNGVGTLAEGAFEKLLPEGLTAEAIDKAVEAQTDAASAISIAFGSNSKAVFDKNKDMQEATLTTKLNDKSTLSVVQKRRTEFNPGPGSNTTEKVVHEGRVRVSLENSWSMSSTAINKHVRQAWSGVSD